MSFFPIQGINPEGGGVEMRQEIDSWFSNPKNDIQKFLFFLALMEFQKMNPLEKDGKLSYYQIAGIHGQPQQPWDGAPAPLPGGPEREPETQTGGYCPHRISTFSTWHRPYLLLFEQRIWETMKKIIGRLRLPNDDKAKWDRAADTWRLPYWDWSTERVPKAVRIPELNILTPEIRVEEHVGILENPLSKFTNPSKIPMGHEDMKQWKIPEHKDPDHGTYPWNECISTSRWGVFDKDIDTQKEWVNGKVDDDKVELALKNHGWYHKPEKPAPQGTIKRLLYMLFAAKFTSWEMFATTRYDDSIGKPKPEEFLSLEYIHNNIHNWAGGLDMSKKELGAGHMSDIDVSAFDPIFYLHHCNIDRLLAIWQILHPDLWFNQPQEDEPKPSDELYPFHINKKGDYWTSDACRDVTKLHYSYADLKKPGKGFKEGEGVNFLDGLRRSINEQYGSMRRNFLGDTDTTGLENDYIVNVVYDPFAFGGAPYTIYFFLGNPDDEGATCIGSVYNFSSSRRSQEGSCANCQQQRANGILAKALVPITDSILHQAKSPNFTDIGSLEQDVVKDYLANHLEWRVVVGGRIINATKEDVPGLKVFAMNGTAEYYEDESKLAKFYDYDLILPATKGKMNGVSHTSECPAALRPSDPQEL